MSLLRSYLESNAILTAADLEVAVRHQQSQGGSLDTALLELGLLTATELDSALGKACGLPTVPARLIETGPTRPWGHVPKALLDIGWAMPLALEDGHVLVAVHPDLPDARLGQLYRQIKGFMPMVAPECLLAKLAAERSGGIVAPRHAMLVLDVLDALQSRDTAPSITPHDTQIGLAMPRIPGAGLPPIPPVPEDSPAAPPAPAVHGTTPASGPGPDAAATVVLPISPDAADSLSATVILPTPGPDAADSLSATVIRRSIDDPASSGSFPVAGSGIYGASNSGTFPAHESGSFPVSNSGSFPDLRSVGAQAPRGRRGADTVPDSRSITPVRPGPSDSPTASARASEPAPRPVPGDSRPPARPNAGESLTAGRIPAAAEPADAASTGASAQPAASDRAPAQPAPSDSSRAQPAPSDSPRATAQPAPSDSPRAQPAPSDSSHATTQPAASDSSRAQPAASDSPRATAQPAAPDSSRAQPAASDSPRAQPASSDSSLTRPAASDGLAAGARPAASDSMSAPVDPGTSLTAPVLNDPGRAERLAQRMAPARAALTQARERDRITDALVQAAIQIAPRVALFGVKREGLRALSAPGSALQLSPNVVIPIPEGSLLDRAVAGQVRLKLLTEPKLAGAVGRPLGIPCLFEPVYALDRCVLMLYVDRDGGLFDAADHNAAKDLCELARASLEALLRLMGLGTQRSAGVVVDSSLTRVQPSGPVSAAPTEPVPTDSPAAPAEPAPAVTTNIPMLSKPSVSAPAPAAAQGPDKPAVRDNEATRPLQAAPPGTVPPAEDSPRPRRSGKRQIISLVNPIRRDTLSYENDGRSGPTTQANPSASARAPEPSDGPVPEDSSPAASEPTIAEPTTPDATPDVEATTPPVPEDSVAAAPVPEDSQPATSPSDSPVPQDSSAATPVPEDSQPAASPADSPVPEHSQPGDVSADAPEPAAQDQTAGAADPPADAPAASAEQTAEPTPAVAAERTEATPPVTAEQTDEPTPAAAQTDEPTPAAAQTDEPTPPVAAEQTTESTPVTAEHTDEASSQPVPEDSQPEPVPEDSQPAAPTPDDASVLHLPNLVAPAGATRAVGKKGERLRPAAEPSLVMPDLRRPGAAAAADPSVISIPLSLIAPAPLPGAKRRGSKTGQNPHVPGADEITLNMPRLVRADAPASEPDADLSPGTATDAPAEPDAPTDLSHPPAHPPEPPTDLTHPAAAAPEPPIDLSHPPDHAAAPPTDLSHPPDHAAAPPTDLSSGTAAEPGGPVDPDAAIEAYLRDPEAPGALARLRAAGSEALTRLAARFPGPIDPGSHTDVRSFPPPSVHGPLLRACVELGEAVTPFILDLVDHPRPQIRFYAAFLFQELRDPRCLRPLAAHAFDPDPDVRLIATRVLESYSRAAGFVAATEIVRAELRSRDRDRALLAAEAAGTLRDTLAVPVLIDLLSVRDKQVRETALEALCSITAKHHGYRPAKWKSWYAENGEQTRIEWVIDALRHRDTAVRRWAADELVRITGHRIPPPPEGEKVTPRHVLARWQEWFDAHGADYR